MSALVRSFVPLFHPCYNSLQRILCTRTTRLFLMVHVVRKPCHDLGTDRALVYKNGGCSIMTAHYSYILRLSLFQYIILFAFWSNTPRSQGLSSYRPLERSKTVRWETLGTRLWQSIFHCFCNPSMLLKSSDFDFFCGLHDNSATPRSWRNLSFESACCWWTGTLHSHTCLHIRSRQRKQNPQTPATKGELSADAWQFKYYSVFFQRS